MINKIQAYIATGQTLKALNKLMYVSEKHGDADMLNNACVLSGEYNSVISDYYNGALSYKDRNTILNRIKEGIIFIYESLELKKK